ncbi:MAG: hypothetical protein DLM57_01735 [Pseudonocardiales bacterium]|nr:MAG: hypothetical protein DLM57_01735 [Pseudonocardiales bacterium]
MLGPEPDVDWYLDHVVVPSGLHRRPVGPILAWEGSWQAEVNALARLDAGPALRRALNLAVGQGFVLTRAQARTCGLPDASVRSLVRRGVWCACAYGVLGVVTVPQLDTAEARVRVDADRRRHALAAAAGALRHPGHVVSGASAAVLHGLPLLHTPIAAQLTAAAPATPGVRRKVLVRPAALEPGCVADWFGAPVTTTARTIVDLARHDRADGLMAADAAVRAQLITEAAIEQVVLRCGGWPGIRQARDVTALASPLAESPLESLTRLALHDSGFPAPELQVVIDDDAYGRHYRVDMLWRERRLVLEADGKVKCTRDELWREKRRELRLTRLGYRVERVTWADVLYDWPESAGRLRAILAASPPR